LVTPLCFYETNEGYKTFNGISDRYDKTSVLLPMVLNVDFNADSINEYYPYNFKNNKTYRDTSFYASFSVSKNTLAYKDRFYNAFAKETCTVD
jgi:hypothetical protein